MTARPATLLKYLASGALALASMMAHAQTVKVGALRTVAMSPVFHADAAGFFKKEGLDVEFVTLGTGPAIGSAVASGAVHVGYSAMIPVIFARAQGQQFRAFANLTREAAGQAGALTWLVASEKSGIKSPKDLAGKTVMTNGASSLCELSFRDHARSAGVEWKSIKALAAPFPQMPAALEIGNADAACVVEPYYTVMRQSPRIKAQRIAAGQISGISDNPGVALDVLFAREDWARQNSSALARFNRAISAAAADLVKNPAEYRKLLIQNFKLEPAVLADMKTDIFLSDFTPRADMVAPLLDALKRNEMLTTTVSPQDLIFTAK